MDLIKISFIIPCYNSEKSIEGVVNEIEEVCKDRYDYRIILSNDGSKDNVWQVIERICESNERVTGICLSTNFGQQSARMAAVPYAYGDYVVFMDDDGQHPASELPQLIDKISEGYDIVYAYFRSKKENLFRVLGSNFNQFTMEWLLGKPKKVKLSSFFVARRYVVDALIRYNSPGPVLNGYFLQITKNIANVELEHRERTYGKSGYTLKKLIHLFMNNATSFSVQPLRLASAVGVIMSSVGFVWALYLIIKKIIVPNVAVGYTSIIVAILICSGLLMIMLGLIGEYIGRMFIVSNNVPQYIVKKIKNGDKMSE